MAIGQHVAKAKAEKELAELAAQEQAADAAAAALEADESVAPVAVPATQVMAGLTFEQMKELFIAAQGSRVSDTQIAEIAANAAAKAKLKCRMYFGSAPIESQTCTPTEIDSLNRLTPGAYRVTKTDGARTVVDVTGQVNANRQIERLWIVIPKDDENKNGYGPNLSYLADQCVDENRVQMVGV